MLQLRNQTALSAVRGFILITIFFAAQRAVGQPFQPDKLGHIADPKFISVIRSKQYQLIGAFDTVSKPPATLKKPVVVAARAYKSRRLIYIDPQGTEINVSAILNTYRAVRGTQGSYSDGGMGLSIPDVVLNEKYEQYVENGKYGTRNIETKKIGLPASYEGLVWMGNGLVQIKTGGLWGFATTDGKTLLTPRYQNINNTAIRDTKGKQLYYSIIKDGKYGLMDMNYKEVIPPVYGYVTSVTFFSNIFMTQQDRKYGLISKSGKELTPFIYSDIMPIGKGLPIVVTTNGQSGLIDSTGRVILETAYQRVEPETNEQQYKITRNGKTGLFGFNGKMKLQPEYDYIFPAVNGLAIVKKDARFGAINKAGKFIVPLNYDRLAFFDTYFIAKSGDISSVIDNKGKSILTGDYQELYPVNGLLLFKSNGEYGLMNRTGKRISRLDYSYVHADHGYLIVEKDNKYGIMDTGGNVLVPIKYDRFNGGEGSVLHDGLLEAILQGGRYLLDLYGNEAAQ